MIKSIFFRALTLLGLTFVLIGCGAADPGEGGTGTPGTAGAAALSMDDVTKEVEKLIRDSKGKVDLADGQAVATKFVSIMKASQPMGSCSLFHTGIFEGFDEAATVDNLTYVTNGNAYPGGQGKLTVELKQTKAAAGVITKDTPIEYKYDNYSIDGIYFLNGTLKMKQATATTAAAWGLSDFTAEASTLKLSMSGVDGAEAKDIAKIAFAAAFKPEFKAEAGKGCGDNNVTIAAQADAITITAIAPTAFTETKMEIKTAATQALGGAYAAGGSNVPLFLALIGPRNS